MKISSSILFGLFICYTNIAFADGPINVSYTGNEVVKANDTGLMPNTYQGIGLGGNVGNDFITEKAFEFTVSQPVTTNYLSINATVVPLSLFPSTETPGPPQNIDVTFKIYEGTQLYGSEQKPAPEFNTLVASTEFDFTTDDSTNNKIYSNFFLPLETDLTPGNTYWIDATDPQYSGVTFNYSTSLIGSVTTTPEPVSSALFLFGGGVLAAKRFFRKKTITV